jgi:hypothetical protein
MQFKQSIFFNKNIEKKSKGILNQTNKSLNKTAFEAFWYKQQNKNRMNVENTRKISGKKIRNTGIENIRLILREN